MNRTVGWALLPVLLLASAACTGTEREPNDDPPRPPAAFADCAVLTQPLTGPSASAGSTGPTRGSTSAPAPSGGETGGPDDTNPPSALPAVTLSCLIGDAEIALDRLRGPAVINLWATWCVPCRKELPAFQRLAERADGTIRVVGVNTSDQRTKAEWFGADFGLRFPNLADPDGRLLRALARQALPITLFVDEQGRIRHRHETGALDDAQLRDLVQRHLGVTVPS